MRVPLLLICLVFGASPALAVALAPGDLIVLDYGFETGGPFRLVHVDPATQVMTDITAGGLLEDPADVALHPDGRVLVADRRNGVIAVDPATGVASVLSALAVGVANGIAVEADGDILISVAQGASGNEPTLPAIVRLDASGGSPTVVAAGPDLGYPAGLAVGPDGDLYVCDLLNPTRPAVGYTYGSVVRIAPATGAVVRRYFSDLFSGPTDIVASPFDGRLYVVQQGLMGRHYYGRIIALDPAGDVSSLFLASNGSLGIAFYSPSVAYTAFFMDPKPGPVGVLRRVGDSSWQVPLAGPLVVVDAGTSTPARSTSWGSVKVRYR